MLPTISSRSGTVRAGKLPTKLCRMVGEESPHAEPEKAPRLSGIVDGIGKERSPLSPAGRDEGRSQLAVAVQAEGVELLCGVEETFGVFSSNRSSG
jgi:hypothetical protein